MTEVEEDDVFLRTDDKIYFQCTRTHENKQDTTKVCLAAESFGTRHCYAEKTQFTERFFNLKSVLDYWLLFRVKRYYKLISKLRIYF